jgi:putative sterol carrier protein
MPTTHISTPRLLILLAAFFCLLPVARADDAKNATPQDVFDGMKKSFKAEKAAGVHASYQWNISGPNGGTWHIVINDGKCEMGKGATDHPDVTFTVSDKDWVAISNDDLSGTYAYLTGRLKLDGPQSIAKKLDAMFP